MNKEDIEEIREYLMDKLEFQGDGSYPKERKILEKLLVITTKCLEVSLSSSSASKKTWEEYTDEEKEKYRSLTRPEIQELKDTESKSSASKSATLVNVEETYQKILTKHWTSGNMNDLTVLGKFGRALIEETIKGISENK